MRDRVLNVETPSEIAETFVVPSGSRGVGHDVEQTPAKGRPQKVLSAILLTLITAGVVVLMLWFTQAARSSGVSDNFDRADGGLGHGWVAMTDGRLSIASHEIAGTAGAEAGEIRVVGNYGNNQYSQIEVTSTQLSGREWIGPTVRTQDDGQDSYLGMYFWNSGDPELRLYKRTSGKWTQLGKSYSSGPLPGGAKLRLTAVGSEISLQQDGTERIAVSDRTLTDGAPGLMTYGAARADNWAGGKATASPPSALQIKYLSTDANGVVSYDFTSADDGDGTHILRVLAPTHPKPGIPYNFLYVLPVEPALGTRWGDGLEVLRKLDAQNDYNLTIIEPSFAKDPWYADNPEGSEHPVRDLPDAGSRAVGHAASRGHRPRAELADRLLEVRDGRRRSDPQTPEAVRGGCILGLPCEHDQLCPVQIELRHRIRNGSQLHGELRAYD